MDASKGPPGDRGTRIIGRTACVPAYLPCSRPKLLGIPVAWDCDELQEAAATARPPSTTTATGAGNCRASIAAEPAAPITAITTATLPPKPQPSVSAITTAAIPAVAIPSQPTQVSERCQAIFSHLHCVHASILACLTRF